MIILPSRLLATAAKVEAESTITGPLLLNVKQHFDTRLCLVVAVVFAISIARIRYLPLNHGGDSQGP